MGSSQSTDTSQQNQQDYTYDLGADTHNNHLFEDEGTIEDGENPWDNESSTAPSLNQWESIKAKFSDRDDEENNLRASIFNNEEKDDIHSFESEGSKANEKKEEEEHKDDVDKEEEKTTSALKNNRSYSSGLPNYQPSHISSNDIDQYVEKEHEFINYLRDEHTLGAFCKITSKCLSVCLRGADTLGTPSVQYATSEEARALHQQSYESLEPTASFNFSTEAMTNEEINCMERCGHKYMDTMLITNNFLTTMVNHEIDRELKKPKKYRRR
mmetsp:Transcript_980/g.1534  ORF Transcript_980/g.1534 Transcript_980/m.1534 type:complete len:270 (-) Transcript_980:78-887(-)|eukprot:CAMPEP_0117429964 /NCGR_PEP_ID=MMETSP0758-20121206/9491_1 /TAXON_ID=63605 /ORGANISM="Percolomonas cosmopolitus, Strain AE-1 (ATCC 50343)" /LENGTH=269 /DNA_ID=CAMNT_0005217485 /DNA_START=31 /DNA_END=840 /DNA_ORIENTATION=+